MNTILVPIDFSHAAQAVLDQAKQLAKAQGAKVILLHVEPPEPGFIGYEPGPQHVRDIVAQEAKDNHHRLHETRDALAADGVEADVLLIQGPTVEKVLEECDRLNADMIVMGSHGHGALFDLLIGSVSEGVIRGAKVPVVIVPARNA